MSYLDLLLATAGLTIVQWLTLSVIVFAAAVLRGYIGFGFSAFVVVASSFFLPIHESVPLVLLMEIAASIQMAASVWRKVRWEMIAIIFVGAFLFIPLGQRLLSQIPVEPMRIIAAVLLLAAVLLMVRGGTFPVMNTRGGWLLIGVVSGFMNGLLAMGGMWLVIFLLNSGITAVTLRASLTLYFFVTDCYAVLTGSAHGLVNQSIIARFFLCLPALIVGIWAGGRAFVGGNEATYKKLALLTLAALAALLLVKGVWGAASGGVL